jgi:SAM-dependent methyltransferase
MVQEYLLGDSNPERARLAAQAALWDPVSHALFDRLGVGRTLPAPKLAEGSGPPLRVLELGPGAGSLNLELRRRVHGPVDIVEQSPLFVEQLKEQWRQDGLGEGRAWNTRILDADLPDDHYDLIFARWVFLFLVDPAAHLRKLARALKPGGRIAIQDYYRNTFCLVPTPPDWPAMIEADLMFFAGSGSDPNVGAHAPLLFPDAGLELVDLAPHTKTGHPGSAVWNWLTTYFLGILETYATLGPLTPEAAARIRTAWESAARNPHSLLIGPTVLDVVGRRSRA